jgi:hypothetical protein
MKAGRNSMQNKRLITLAAAAILAVAAPSLAQSADISGTWDVVITTQQGTMPASPMELRKDGDQFVGVFYTQQGNADVVATIKETTVTFQLPPFQTQQGPIQLVMSGTIVDADTMRGTLAADAGGGSFSMDWSARRTQAPPAEPKTAPVDLTGTWGLEVVTQAGTGHPTIVLKQEGERLTGQYSGQLGEAPITGTIKGNEFSFSFTFTMEGATATVIYSGTADGDAMKGTVTLGELGEGTFTGKKK